MGMQPFKEVLFEGAVPEITRIAAKVLELSGLAVRIRQTVDRKSAKRYELDGSLAFECASNDAIWLIAMREGAETETLPYWAQDYGEEDPPGKRAMYLTFGGLEPTLRTYILLALQALGGELKHPLDEEPRRLCAAPITELELERRKWKASGKQLLTTLTSGFTEAFYEICEVLGIQFPHRQLHHTERQSRHVLVRIALFPFKLFFSILGAIIIAISAPLISLFLFVTFAGKTARLVFHMLITSRKSP